MANRNDVTGRNGTVTSPIGTPGPFNAAANQGSTRGFGPGDLGFGPGNDDASPSLEKLGLGDLIGASPFESADLKAKDQVPSAVSTTLSETLAKLEQKFQSGTFDAAALPLVRQYLDEMRNLAAIQLERNEMRTRRVSDVKEANTTAYNAVCEARAQRERAIRSEAETIENERVARRLKRIQGRTARRDDRLARKIRRRQWWRTRRQARENQTLLRDLERMQRLQEQLEQRSEQERPYLQAEELREVRQFRSDAASPDTESPGDSAQVLLAGNEPAMKTPPANAEEQDSGEREEERVSVRGRRAEMKREREQAQQETVLAQERARRAEAELAEAKARREAAAIEAETAESNLGRARSQAYESALRVQQSATVEDARRAAEETMREYERLQREAAAAHQSFEELSQQAREENARVIAQERAEVEQLLEKYGDVADAVRKEGRSVKLRARLASWFGRRRHDAEDGDAGESTADDVDGFLADDTEEQGEPAEGQTENAAGQDAQQIAEEL